MTGQDLKNSILQLAIQGKLVPQDANDEPASVLLERIKAEKQKLINEKKIKKEKPLPEITDEEKPFEIPESWEWCRLGEIITMLSGQDFTPDKYHEKEVGVPYITGASNLKDEKVIVNRWTSCPTVIANRGDLLIVCKGSGVGKMAFCTVEEAHIARQIQCIKNYQTSIYISFIKYVITYSLNDIVNQANGLIPGIARDVLLSHIIPLPPLSEQHRIVAKIEELMPLVEEYDKAQKELDALNAKLPEALKKSILQEAIQGKLVPQDPNDEPASVLLQRIRKEKEQLVKDGKLKKKDLVTTPISDEEKPFEIPESWEWCRLKDLVGVISDGTHKTPSYKESGVPFLSVQNISSGKLSLDRVKYISEEEHLKLCERVKPQLGDILVCRIGTLGKALEITWDFEFSIFVSLGLLRPVYADVTPYIILFINSPIGKAWIDEVKVGGGTHTYKINLSDFPNMLIPLPPLAEQHHIVSKIEDLFAQIEPLAKALSTPM